MSTDLSGIISTSNDDTLGNVFQPVENKSSIDLEHENDELSVYVINLDRTPERYNKVKMQLNNHGIKHTRFSAIDGYEVKLIDQNNNNDNIFSGLDVKAGKIQFTPYESSYKVLCGTESFSYLNAKHLITAGEFGVTCSHLTIWKEIVDKKLSYALILEDDVIFKRKAHREIEKILTNLPSKWDIIYVHLDKKNTYTDRLNNFNSILQEISPSTKGKTLSSLAAYFVSYDGAKNLLDNTHIFSGAVDIEVGKIINSEKVKAYKAKKEFIAASIGYRASNSIIYAMGRNHF